MFCHGNSINVCKFRLWISQKVALDRSVCDFAGPMPPSKRKSNGADNKSASKSAKMSGRADPDKIMTSPYIPLMTNWLLGSMPLDTIFSITRSKLRPVIQTFYLTNFYFCLLSCQAWEGSLGWRRPCWLFGEKVSRQGDSLAVHTQHVARFGRVNLLIGIIIDCCWVLVMMIPSIFPDYLYTGVIAGFRPLDWRFCPGG